MPHLRLSDCEAGQLILRITTYKPASRTDDAQTTLSQPPCWKFFRGYDNLLSHSLFRPSPFSFGSCLIAKGYQEVVHQYLRLQCEETRLSRFRKTGLLLRAHIGLSHISPVFPRGMVCSRKLCEFLPTTLTRNTMKILYAEIIDPLSVAGKLGHQI
ncbi:hypothetical protein VTI28DRAFT_9120 [Corynascus sepedonium]